MKNIACNLIYNNGGEGVYVGFEKRCDINNIIYNVEFNSQRWCSQSACSCKKFYDRNFTGKHEEFPCNESKLFVDWQWTPGNEFKTGKPFRILKSGLGKIAILTTRFANTQESDRKIVGFFKIDEITDDFHRFVADKNKSIRLKLTEAQQLNFWNYHRNARSSNPEWRSKRFRYLEDQQVAAILHDLLKVVQNERNKSMIYKVLETNFSKYSLKRPNVTGALG